MSAPFSWAGPAVWRLAAEGDWNIAVADPDRRRQEWQNGLIGGVPAPVFGETEMATIDDVLRFWFVESGPANWFAKDDAFDQRVRDRLMPALEDAESGKLANWSASPRGSLALCILLDQAPRNLFRGQADQFRADPQALRLAKQAIDRGFDRYSGFQPTNRMFIYLPLEHSESLEDQRLSVRLFRERVGDPETVRYADLHLAIIERFGRFPHRNAALGRSTTDEEAAFLQEPNSSF